MPFSFFARDEMYVLLESFQLSCIRDCDERNQRHVKLLESGFDLFIFFSLRDHFISGCFPFYVSREGFFFFSACVLNSRFLVLPYRSAPSLVQPRFLSHLYTS